MREETKQQIYQYLKKYLNQKKEHSDYIDYYELCNLDKNMTIEQLQKEIKKKNLQKLFHPDQEGFLEKEFQSVFKECSSKIRDMESKFSNQTSKDYYDKELTKRQDEESKRRSNEELERQRNRNTATNTAQGNKDVDITLEERKYVERALETTIHKFGFYHGYMAIQKAARNDFSNITRENHSRELLQQLGAAKIRKVIESEETDIMEKNPNNMVMNYYWKVINKRGLQEKAEVFYNACLQTALKYDLNNNAEQTEWAIFQYISYSNMNAFTNRNVDKSELSKLSPQDVQMLICAKMHSLGKENSDYLFSNFTKNNKEEQVKIFATEIQKEARSIAAQRKAM